MKFGSAEKHNNENMRGDKQQTHALLLTQMRPGIFIMCGNCHDERVVIFKC